MTLIDAIQNFAVDTGGYEHLLGSGWNYMATDQANYGMIAAWRYLNGMRSLYDMRPEFTEEQKEQIQSLKDTIDAAVAKKGEDGYYEALVSAKETYDTAVAGFEDPTLRNYVSNYWELMDALEEEENQSAQKVVDLIDAIGEVTLESEGAIQEAREAYEALSAEQKEKVTNYEKLTAAEKALEELKDAQAKEEIQEVMDKIDAIGEVTLDSEKAIAEAEKAYEALSEKDQKLVTNYETLVKARETYEQMKEAYQAFITGKPAVKAEALSYHSVKISWEPYEDTKSYYVYRKTKGQTFKRIAWIQDLSELSYVDETAETGITYYYTVKAASKTWGEPVYSKYVTDVTAKTALGKGSVSKTQTWGYNGIKVTWDEVDGADGYRLYYKVGNSAWKYATQTGSTSYVHTSVTTGQTYTYYVRAYRNVNGSKVYGAYSAGKTGKAVPKKSVITKITAGSKKAALKWNKVNGASGYRIYYKTSENGAWHYVTQIGKGSTTSYTDTGLKSGQTYYYTMRAYRTVNGEKIFGSYSDWKTVKVK